MNWLTLLIIPVIVGVIVVLIEYYIIQPIKQSKEIPLPIHLNRGWGNGIRKAVKQFKAQQSGFENEGFFNTKKDNSTTFMVEKCTVYRGKAILVISVSYIGVSGDYISLNSKDKRYWNITKKYQLEVDRTGDILKSSEIDFQQTPIGGEIPPTKLSVQNIKSSTGKVSNGTVKVFISFEIKNEGQAGKICPQIEYPIVLMSKRKYEPAPHIANMKQVEIPALSTILYKYEENFNFMDVPVISDLSKIKVRLKSCA